MVTGWPSSEKRRTCGPLLFLEIHYNLSEIKSEKRFKFHSGCFELGSSWFGLGLSWFGLGSNPLIYGSIFDNLNWFRDDLGRSDDGSKLKLDHQI